MQKRKGSLSNDGNSILLGSVEEKMARRANFFWINKEKIWKKFQRIKGTRVGQFLILTNFYQFCKIQMKFSLVKPEKF